MEAAPRQSSSSTRRAPPKSKRHERRARPVSPVAGNPHEALARAIPALTPPENGGTKDKRAGGGDGIRQHLQRRSRTRHARPLQFSHGGVVSYRKARPPAPGRNSGPA